VTTREEREQFARYKEDVERRGKSFFPHAIFHDTVMSFVVVSVIAALAAIWYYTSEEAAGEAGWLGPRYSAEADPGTTSFVPRPDWYFYFLFYLLRIFKWPESVILGTVGIPTILLILLMMVPFFDRRRERRLVRRPVAIVASLLVIASMGILTYKGATAEEPLAGAGAEFFVEWKEAANLPDAAEPGAVLFAEVGCINCHNYLGDGAQGPGPDLTDVGTQGQGEDYWVRWVANAPALGGQGMPPFPTLTEQQLRDIAIFLEASKGEGGGG
jgi:menaquinol-cytochrome c reductase cytochrome b/c subunit